VELRVDGIKPAKWNKAAFDTLAVDADTKELIIALVSNKIAADRGTDLVYGKGTGLIVLLHGGPGTGKTLTAESVAEIAEKPLYRVTCGDIGTDPINIEKYLESVFYLGRIWDCVVLLDEADVFLEQRSLSDLSRNALVSVFLRVLEYYDGIMVLTSNRVGIFDEAFKSRIHLALHYDMLNKTQRKQIWENFARHLNSMKDSNIDFDDVVEHLEQLSAYEMNGRQIRNVITTGRQLAIHKKTKLDWACLKHIIVVSERFEKYLKDVNQNITDAEWAREQGTR
jgi:SpoVK/Ycf46/Vps4 family AAA+-type ATPase